MLADGALVLLVQRDVRVGEVRRALHTLLVYPQCDRSRAFFAHAFYGKQMVLPLESQHAARRNDVHEP